MKHIVLCLLFVLVLLTGCLPKGDDGKTGSSGPIGPTGPAGSPGNDSLISSNTYLFTSTSNTPAGHSEVISEILFGGIYEGWQTVSVYLFSGAAWVQLPFTLGNGSVDEIDYYYYVSNGLVRVLVAENGGYYDPPLVGYQDYMVIVQTFNH